MRVLDLIEIARHNFLDDGIKPYKWSDTVLAQYASEAEKEAAKRASLLLDDTTETADNVASGTATGTTTDKLVDSGATFTASMVGKTVYNNTDKTWAVVTALDSPTQLSLSSDIMASGEVYVIGDASKALCRVCVIQDTGNYSLSEKVITIGDCYLESSDGVPLIKTTKGWLNRNYYQWRIATGTPRFYLGERNRITLVPMPDSTFNNNTGRDILNLSVYRLPLLDLTLDIEADKSPEIPEEYHFYLIDYICHLCYSKQDSDTMDLRKATWHLSKFEAKFGKPLSAHAETVLHEIPGDFTLEKQFFGL